jgi:RNA polymerase sigma factor (sigma-70 family)
MENPAGYLYRVGASRIRPPKARALFDQPDETSFSFEPELRRALSELPERQRVAVVLIHGYGWTSTEVADMTGVRPSTIQTHLARGLASLRNQLKVEGKEYA